MPFVCLADDVWMPFGSGTSLGHILVSFVVKYVVCEPSAIICGEPHQDLLLHVGVFCFLVFFRRGESGMKTRLAVIVLV